MYCTKCGTENEEDAAFCKKCGKPLAGGPPPPPSGTPEPALYPPGHEVDRRGYRRKYEHEKDWDKECEEDCSGASRKYSWFWGVIIILIGFFIIYEAGIKNIEGLPDWVYDIEIWWVIPVLIGLIIIMIGAEAIGKSGRQR